ncbi:hypothetical protein Q3G72_025016 [Acer saccharum]|nr:hypothetical protein Q3G72_025016 [Acer saccharum]
MLDHVLAADLVAGVTKGSEFASPTLGGIFDRIRTIRSRGEAVDADTLPAYYLRWNLPIPDDVPDPATWSRHDKLGVARELAHVIHSDHVRRQATALLTSARSVLADRAVDPVSTMSLHHRELGELLDETTDDEDEPGMLLGDILAMETTYDWIVPDLLERKDRLIVTGPEGSGKSMLVRQLAVCAAAGLHPFTYQQHEPCSVLVIDVENTRQQWQRKTMWAAKAAQFGRRDPRQHLTVINHGRINLVDAAHEALVHRWVDRYKPDLLAIGPLYKLTSGAITTDDDAAPLIAALDGLRDRGLTLVMEAHTGHATGGGGDREPRPRGSSALMGWPEFGFGIFPTADNKRISKPRPADPEPAVGVDRDAGRMSTTDVLERLDGVKQVHGGWLARCPAHEDRSPSLSIGTGESRRILLRCFAGCETVDVVAAIGLTMKDLAGDAVIDAPRVERREIVRPKPLPWDQERMQALVDEAADRLTGEAGDHVAVRYARDRFGVTLADVHRLRLGYLPMFGGSPRLVIPFRDTFGVARGMQARALDPDAKVRWLSPRSPTRGEWSRWGWFRGRVLDAPVIVTEGPGDALSAVTLGYHAIAIRGASNATDAATQRAVRAQAGNRKILIAGDGDEAGEGFSRALAQALQSVDAWHDILPMPQGMDLTDFLRDDADACAAMVRAAVG